MSATWFTCATLASAALSAATFPRILSRLPAPRGETTNPYRGHVTGRTTGWATATITTLTALALHAVPDRLWPLWLVITLIAGSAVCIDELTMFLPKILTDLATAGCLVALGVGWAVGGLGWGQVLRAVAAGIVVRSVFWVIWRIGGSMGFGDVRLALVCGLGAGVVSWRAVVVAMVAGTVLPVIHGLVERRPGGRFPYGPGLLLGTVVAVCLLH